VIRFAALALLLLSAQSPATIDSILEETWKEKGIAPASRSSDAEFLRRVRLDLTGTVPGEEELAAFLKKPDRARKIDELLDSPGYASFMGETFALSLYGYESKFDTSRGPLEVWLRKAFEKNEPWDRVVSDLLTATGASEVVAPVNFVARHLPNGSQPEEMAVKSSRMFLGMRLGCAKCHDHPFDKWTQEDFYSFAAFFRGTNRQYVSNGRVVIENDPARAKARWVPEELKKPVRPKFLNGTEPSTAALRDELALMITTNRQFARATANRAWYHLFGRGVVHPIDNFSAKNPASVAKLVDHLADELIRVKYDLKALFRMIANSKAYQLTSSGTDAAAARVFAVSAVRPLTAGQRTDAALKALKLDEALPRAQVIDIREKSVRFRMRNVLEEDLTSVFEYRESVGDVMQGMTLDLGSMKGKGIFAEKLTVDRVYAMMLSRPPTAREKGQVEAFLKKGGTLEELVVVLLNSHEFSFNH
jgi:hypothetical protein